MRSQPEPLALTAFEAAFAAALAPDADPAACAATALVAGDGIPAAARLHAIIEFVVLVGTIYYKYFRH